MDAVQKQQIWEMAQKIYIHNPNSGPMDAINRATRFVVQTEGWAQEHLGPQPVSSSAGSVERDPLRYR